MRDGTSSSIPNDGDEVRSLIENMSGSDQKLVFEL